jgi:mono/diheme cytochrome c family protein
MRLKGMIALLAAVFLVACGGTAESAAPPPTPTLSPQLSAGRQLFVRECASCHSLSPNTVIVGPSLAGIATLAADRVPDQDAHTYILVSILTPDAYLVEGFENLMPASFGKKLTGEELDALVAYLLALP